MTVGMGGNGHGEGRLSGRPDVVSHARSGEETAGETAKRGRMERHDEGYMRRALELAARGWGLASPNPLVGAVIVSNGDVVGEGWYQGPRGNPHAEIVALGRAGARAAGATVVCTLEPCDHHGATPPCTRALIDAGVRRVVVAATDPNPVVDGRGLARLRDAGLDVVVGLLEPEARRLNEAFEKHVTTGIPFVTLKMASTLDGKAAAVDGTSRWITGEAAREDVQRLRAGADAVMVGAGTAVVDDPALTVRDPRYPQAVQPLRVVLDARGRVEASGRLFDGGPPTLVATTDRAVRSRVAQWQEAGAEVLVVESDREGGVSIPHLLEALGKRDVMSVLVEGGPTLGWSFVRDGSVDKVIVYLAPLLAGGRGALGMLTGEGFAPIGEALPLELSSVDRVGRDLKVEAYVHGDRRRAR